MPRQDAATHPAMSSRAKLVLLTELHELHTDLLNRRDLHEELRHQACGVVNMLSVYADDASDVQVAGAIRRAIGDVHAALIAGDLSHSFDWLRNARAWRDNAAIRWRCLHDDQEPDQ